MAPQAKLPPPPLPSNPTILAALERAQRHHTGVHPAVSLHALVQHLDLPWHAGARHDQTLAVVTEALQCMVRCGGWPGPRTPRSGRPSSAALLDDDLRVTRTLVGGHEAHAP
jgi:hypothetical protein